MKNLDELLTEIQVVPVIAIKDTMDDSGTPAGSYAIWRAEDGAWALERFYPATVFE